MINEIFHCWDKQYCPIYVGVHIKRLSVEWGSTVLYFKIIIVGVVLQLLA